MLQEIVNEINRRNNLRQFIETVIDLNFDFKPGYHIRRGQVQSLVADTLGVHQNNQLARAVIDFVTTRGATLVTIKGKLYFKGMTVRRK